MKQLHQNQLTSFNGGYCVEWLGPNDNAGDNANPQPLPFTFCNHCLFVSAISQNPNLVNCPY